MECEMRQTLIILLALLLGACGNSDSGTEGEECGPSACGACEDGCTAADECVDGQWQCNCDCPSECGPSACGACPDGCTAADECVDGQWQCNCDC